MAVTDAEWARRVLFCRLEAIRLQDAGDAAGAERFEEAATIGAVVLDDLSKWRATLGRRGGRRQKAG